MRPPFAPTHDRKAIEIGGDGHDALRRKLEKRLQEMVERSLSGQRERVLGRIRYGQVVDDVFWKAEVERLQQELLPHVNAAIAESQGIAVQDLAALVHVGIDAAMFNARLAKWARTYSFDLIKDITDNTRRAVQEAVMNWSIMGEEMNELTKLLEPLFGPVRGKLIAETEITRLFAMAHLESWRLSGVVEAREWRTANDEVVCPICGELAGQQAELDKGFIGGVSDPPAHPRCRCWTVPVIRTVRR